MLGGGDSPSETEHCLYLCPIAEGCDATSWSLTVFREVVSGVIALAFMSGGLAESWSLLGLSSGCWTCSCGCGSLG